eukprot:19682-Heterococcus_DN1.PRE.1
MPKAASRIGGISAVNHRARSDRPCGDGPCISPASCSTRVSAPAICACVNCSATPASRHAVAKFSRSSPRGWGTDQLATAVPLLVLSSTAGGVCRAIATAARSSTHLSRCGNPALCSCSKCSPSAATSMRAASRRKTLLMAAETALCCSRGVDAAVKAAKKDCKQSSC